MNELNLAAGLIMASAVENHQQKIAKNYAIERLTAEGVDLDNLTHQDEKRFGELYNSSLNNQQDTQTSMAIYLVVGAVILFVVNVLYLVIADDGRLFVYSVLAVIVVGSCMIVLGLCSIFISALKK